MKHARSDFDTIQDTSGRIPADEPVFLLRATDALAPAAIMHWAHLLELNGGDSALANTARKQARAMADYRAKDTHIPDAPAEVLR